MTIHTIAHAVHSVMLRFFGGVPASELARVERELVRFETERDRVLERRRRELADEVRSGYRDDLLDALEDSRI